MGRVLHPDWMKSVSHLKVYLFIKELETEQTLISSYYYQNIVLYNKQTNNNVFVQQENITYTTFN